MAAPVEPTTLRVPVLDVVPQRTSNRTRFWRAFRRNRVAVFGMVIVAIITFSAIFADVIAPYDPD